MTDGTKNSGVLQSLVGTGFEDMQYYLWASLEKFDRERFARETGVDLGSQSEDSSTTIPQKDPVHGEYHITFRSWLDEDKEITFRIDYKLGLGGHRRPHHGPYAEDFMNWLGNFFKYETAQAHIHASFRYPLSLKQSRFPLPLKTPLEGEAEINGISVRFGASPKGVSQVRLLHGQESWMVELIANRRIAFKEYSIYTDLEAFLSTIDTLLEEKVK